MKTFCHKFVELEPLEQINSENGRKYKTPGGNFYPSVTTILGKTLDKKGLDKWIKMVGEEEANRIKNSCGNRGTYIHSYCEDLILNKPLDYKSMMPIHKSMFKQLEKLLIEHVDNIRVSEGYLYSDTFKVAGAVDLIAEYDGVLSIIDFKTSRSRKNKDHILGYFLQVSLYAYMFWERTGILINDLVLTICIEDENEAQVFKAKATDYLDYAKTMCRKFHLEN